MLRIINTPENMCMGNVKRDILKHAARMEYTGTSQKAAIKYFDNDGNVIAEEEKQAFNGELKTTGVTSGNTTYYDHNGDNKVDEVWEPFYKASDEQTEELGEA